MPDSTTTVEVCDGLHTKPTPVIHLRRGTYVLLAGDVEETEDPVLIPADHPDPVLWRFAALDSHRGDGMTMWFDAPDEAEMLELTVEYTAAMREVLPGQDHQRWDGVW